MGAQFQAIQDSIIYGQKTGIASMVRLYPRSITLYLRCVYNLYREHGHRKYSGEERS